MGQTIIILAPTGITCCENTNRLHFSLKILFCLVYKKAYKEPNLLTFRYSLQPSFHSLGWAWPNSIIYVKPKLCINWTLGLNVLVPPHLLAAPGLILMPMKYNNRRQKNSCSQAPKLSEKITDPFAYEALDCRRYGLDKEIGRLLRH